MSYLENIPQYIRSILLSPEFYYWIDSVKSQLNLFTKEQDALNDIIEELFKKNIRPEDLRGIFLQRLGISEEQATALERTFFINLVLPFIDFFGNHIEYFQKKYGDPEKALEESKTMPLLLKTINEALREKAAEIEDLDANREKGAVDMAALFEKNLTCHFYAPDDPYKVSLNNTIIFLISNIEGFVDTLLKSLYANEEHIGKETMRVGEKDGQPPTVGNWIQDLLGFSGGTASSIKIAQYMTDNANAKKLSEKDKEALRRLFETFTVLKNFPESFQKTSPEHWMVIPYHLAELEAKTARELPGVPGEEQNQESRITGQNQESRITGQNQESRITGQNQESRITNQEKEGSLPAVAALPRNDVAAVASVHPEPLLQPTTYNLQPALVVDYDRVITHILEAAAVKLSDDVTSRVKPILSSRVRNIRNSIDTSERLKAALADGGAGLSPEDAEKLLKEANVAAQAIVAGKGLEQLYDSGITGQNQESRITGQNQESRITNQGGAQKQESRITGQNQESRITNQGGAQKQESRITNHESMAEMGSATPSLKPETYDLQPVPEPPLKPQTYNLKPEPVMVIKEVDGVPMLVQSSAKRKMKNEKLSLEKTEKQETGITNQEPRITNQGEARGGQGQNQESRITGQNQESRITNQGEVQTPPATPVGPQLTPKPSTLAPSTAPPLKPETYNLKPIPIPVTVRATPTAGAPKTKVADVKAAPRLVGVIDEIRALTIKDFRRLSQDPKESVKRIYEKIQALEKQSLTKKAEAIKAWKESDVYALYLEIGQINIGVDMNKLVEERKTAGKEYLTAEEFDALLELNEKLRF
ncbi:hypothetical protein HY732_02310 [Candidatus Uhrbacteria bacterium]|nr:hypothetical protein [Candidatus Uhrbacteria bacterium]